MKEKKLKEFFYNLNKLNFKKPEELHLIDSPIKFNYASGNNSGAVKLIPTSGKYLLPETQKIIKIFKGEIC